MSDITVIDRSNELAPPLDPKDEGVLQPDPEQAAIDAAKIAAGQDPHDCSIPATRATAHEPVAAAPALAVVPPPVAPAAPGASPHVSARNAILSRPNKLRDKLVTVHSWVSDELPVVSRELVDGTIEQGNVLVIECNGLRRAELLQHAADGGGRVELKRIYPDMVIACAHHPANRAPLFLPSDRDALLHDSGSAIESVATVAGQLSGMDSKAAASAEGNSSASRS